MQIDDSVEEELTVSELFDEVAFEGESIFSNDLHLTAASSSCDEKEREILF